MSANMRAIPAQGQHRNRRWVRVPHEVQKDQLKKRAGKAYREMGASVDEIRIALGLKSHSGASRRTRGDDNPLAAYLEEVRAFVLNGHEIDSHIAAIIATAAEAKQERGESFCVTTFALKGQALDAEEDAARSAYLAGRTPKHIWADKLERYLAYAIRHLPHLRKEAV